MPLGLDFGDVCYFCGFETVALANGALSNWILLVQHLILAIVCAFTVVVRTIMAISTDAYDFELFKNRRLGRLRPFLLASCVLFHFKIQ
jgi:hypothetical protein